MRYVEPRLIILSLAAAIPDIQQELHASDSSIALSLSLYAIFQGGVPLLWSALSEFWGRKVGQLPGLHGRVLANTCAESVPRIHRAVHARMHRRRSVQNDRRPRRHALHTGHWVCPNLPLDSASLD